MRMKLLSADAIRRCLIADPGHSILSADFDQIEYRIIGAMAGETKIIEAAHNGISIHKLTAKEIFGENFTADEYRYAKNLNFGWAFGGGATTLAQQTGIAVAKSRVLITKFEAVYPALKAYKRRETEAILRMALSRREYSILKGLRSQMYAYRADTPAGRHARATIQREIKRLTYGKVAYCTTAYGRRLPVDVGKAYTVINYKVQSTARDILGEALLRIMDDTELEPTLLLPVHDELLGQAPISKAEYIARRYGEVMTTEFMGVPLTAEGKVYGPSWGHGYVKEST